MSIYASLAPNGCFANCNVANPRADANDAELAARLWETSEKIVAGLPA